MINNSNRAWREATRRIQRRDTPGAKWIPGITAGRDGLARAMREGRISLGATGEADGYYVGPAARLRAEEDHVEAAQEGCG